MRHASIGPVFIQFPEHGIQDRIGSLGREVGKFGTVCVASSATFVLEKLFPVCSISMSGRIKISFGFQRF